MYDSANVNVKEEEDECGSGNRNNGDMNGESGSVKDGKKVGVKKRRANKRGRKIRLPLSVAKVSAVGLSGIIGLSVLPLVLSLAHFSLGGITFPLTLHDLANWKLVACVVVSAAASSAVTSSLTLMIIRVSTGSFSLSRLGKSNLATSGNGNMLSPLLDENDGDSDEDEQDDDEDDVDCKRRQRNRALRLLVSIALPDSPILLVAFMFLLVAAVANGFIPRIIGTIIDVVAPSSISPVPHEDLNGISKKNLHEFHTHLLLLVVAGFVGAFATACRGGIFTLSMARQNVRIRDQLFKSIIQQDIGFFDVTKVGDLTSRLTSDTTRVSDSIALNINVLLRSIVQAIVVFIFMMHVNIKLSLITLCAVPVVSVMAKVKHYNCFRVI